MIDIKPAKDISDKDLCDAMNDAFSDYVVPPPRLSLEGFQQMMSQRGLIRSCSLVATENEEVAAIWLVSVRGDKAYLIASGTRPKFRSKGIARRLADACLSDLVKTGISTFQTEVMDGNDIAAGLYFSLGMTVSRQLDCYDIPEPPAAEPRSSNVAAADWRDILAAAPALRSWEPSWQNNDLSVGSISGNLHCARIDDDKGLAAYAALIPQSATLAQIAVRPDCRRRKLGTAIVANLKEKLPDRPLRILNAQAGDSEFSGFMQALGASKTVVQRELCMRL
ncbi:MAG: GNAT family N-acetyltransferase [Pseudomonadota bacterium]